MGARFVRLGIAGFKSFADSASIEIQPGLTGIVGPNGCGKSNVAEALRWAMGESNARTLRGGEMDDVIFAGSASRPGRNLAEVTLHVEGDEAGLPPPFAASAEVQVVRRIERGAGGSYRVNGREVRARDVQTLFADMASGARSSAMVSQGRVGALVNARPEERRPVLEEAAGITGLHARRAEAETRLRGAEANVERAEERRGILARQLEGLMAQARQASRYRAVTEAAMETEAALLALQQARAQAACRAAEEAVAEAHQAMAQAEAARDAAHRVAAAAALELPARREAEAEARAGQDQARLRGEAAMAEARREEAESAAAQQRLAQLKRDLDHAASVVAESTGADLRLAAEAERLVDESARHPERAAEAEMEAAAAASALLDADAAAASTAAAVAEAGAKADSLRQLVQHARGRRERARENSARLTAERGRALVQVVEPARLRKADVAADAAATGLEQARQEADRAEASREAARAAAAAAREAFLQADAARHRLAAETGALAEVLAVKDGETWRPLLDRVTVADGFEAALGAAFGHELSAAEDAASARHWRELPPLPVREVPGTRLDAAVSSPPMLARALGAVGVVRSTEEGDQAQGRLEPGQMLVSTDGAMWRWDGYSVRGGTPTEAGVRLKQRNRLAGLQTALQAAEQVAARARGGREEADRVERTAMEADAGARRHRRDLEGEAERSRATAQTLHTAAQHASARLAAADEQLAQAEPERLAAELACDAAEAEATDAPDVAELRRLAERARAAVGAARSRDLAAQRELHGLVQTEAARQQRSQVIVRERADRRFRATDLAERVTDLSARMAEARRECESRAAVPAPTAAAASMAAEVLAAATAAFRGANEARLECEALADRQAGAARQAEAAAFEARETSIRAEAAKEAATQAAELAKERSAERAGALPPFPEAPADVSAAAEDRCRNRLQRLLREREDLGPVNLRADIEAEAIGADIATIDSEREELGTAIAKLRGSIGHLNREGRERLTAVFHAVDRHFQTLFTRMFGGGRAHLALVGSDDPLLAGLEIFAQPPGKKLATLSLLSGGEQALTALSLVFAVFRCNPAPLCVLDEVDAPLDDANVERFCALLADMVQETSTRFLVVTHHQVTMARMDRLYGVTMQERGVSRVLSVDLTHASAMVEAVAAE